MAQQMKITGIRQMTGKTESGFSYDYARVFAIGRMDPTAKDRSGYAGIEMRALPQFYEKYLDFDFKPEGVLFEIEIEQIASGRGEFRDTITKMEPILQPVETTKPPFDVKAK